ncbi:hypothetical protein ACQ4WX_46450 [Streptomyces lasalocidi]
MATTSPTGTEAAELDQRQHSDAGRHTEHMRPCLRHDVRPSQPVG